MSKDQRGPLTQESIVAAAVELADEAGVDGLTMRKLAKRLGYEVMSLYNHVANKDELLGSMLDAVAGSIDLPPADLPPIEGLRSLALATRQGFVDHPWAAELWMRHLPGQSRIRHMEYQLEVLAESGLAHDLAHHGFHAVNNHVLGYTLQLEDMTGAMENPEALAKQFMDSLSPDVHPRMIEHVALHLDGKVESSFELVLDLILDGLVALNESR